MAIDIIIEDGAPNPGTVAEPTPLEDVDARELASVNAKLDAILSALGISYGEGGDGDE